MEKILLEVDGQDAERTIKEIRAELKDAKAAFENAAIGSEEFEEATKKVADIQQELKDAVNNSSISIQDAQKAVDVAGKSYSELTAEMAELKKAWKATNDETARVNIGQNIDAINNKLKEMDATIGNYQRNVGNYSSAFAGFESSLQNIGAKITENGNAFKMWGANAQQGIGGLATGFKTLGKALIANPIGALITIIGLLIPLFQKLADKISVGRETMEKLNVVGALLEVPLNLIATAIEKLINIIADGVQWLINFADKLGLIPQAAKDAMEASKALADAENELRESSTQLAVVQAEMAEERAKAADEDLTLAEREESLTKAHNAEIDALKAAAKAADDMYQAMLKQAALSPTSKEDEEKLAQARIKAANAQKAVNDEVRTYNKQIAKFHRQAIDAERAAMEARNKEHEKYLAQLAKDKSDYKALIDLKISNEQQYTAEYMRLQAERIELERAEQIEKAKLIRVEEVRGETITQINKRFDDQQRQLIEQQKAYQAEIAASAAKLQAEVDSFFDNEDAAEIALRMRELSISVLDAVPDDVNLWQIWLDPDKALEEVQKNAEVIEELKTQLSDFREWEYESAEEAAIAREELSKRLADAETKASNDSAKADAANSAKRLKATKQTFSGMVSALQSWSESSSKAKAAYKATATAETAMNTAEGAMAAYKAMAGIPYVGPALGIAAAAAVVAEGAAQIKNINASDSGQVSSGGGGGNVNAAASAAPAQTATLSNVESAFIESRAENQEQRVTIVASDIVAAYDNYKQVEVQNG